MAAEDFLQNAEPTHIEDSEASFPLGWKGRIKPGDRLLAFGLLPGQNYVGFRAVEHTIAVRNPLSLSLESQAVKAHGGPSGSAKVPRRRHGFMSTDGSRPWLMFHHGGSTTARLTVVRKALPSSRTDQNQSLRINQTDPGSLVELAPCPFEEAPDIVTKRPPGLQVKIHLGPPPQRDFSLTKDRARAHSNREGGERQVKRTAMAKYGGSLATINCQTRIAVADIDQRMRQVRERSIEPARDRLAICVRRKECPFVGTEAKRRAGAGNGCATYALRQRALESLACFFDCWRTAAKHEARHRCQGTKLSSGAGTR